jgi:hypothetical protein
MGYFAGNNADGLCYVSGNHNTGLGYYSLAYIHCGCENTSIGGLSMYAMRCGHGNTAIGYYSMVSSQAGNCNVAIGRYAGCAITNGGANIVIGNCAGSGITTCSGTIAIGHPGANNSNYIYMGSTSVVCAMTQVAWATYSDRTQKENIVDICNGLCIIRMLKPSAYNVKWNRNGKCNFGFIAQDVATIFSPGTHEIVGNEDGTYNLRYQDFIPINTAAIKELDSCVSCLTECVSCMDNCVWRLSNCISSMDGCILAMNDKIECLYLMIENLVGEK